MVQVFSQTLISWYRKNARDLPWRRTSDPYKIWISEVMLQQTTVKAVIPYYERWLKVFPVIERVAKAPLEKVLKIWQGLGYYQRAKNIHKSARLICEQYQGKIPHSLEELKKLPGFGPYTAGAVLSIAFDQRQPIIDANVRRVIMRQQAMEGYADSSQDPKIGEFLEKMMPPEGNDIFNQALMELGALVCRNREPLCILCPVRRPCLAYQRGLQEIIPAPKKKIIQDINVAIALIKRHSSYFIQQRPSRGLFADLWEFPGGKIKEGETPRQAISRELKEELNATVTSARHLFDIRQYYTQFRANLQVWDCRLSTYPKINRIRKYVSLSGLGKYPMPSGSAKILDRLLPAR